MTELVSFVEQPNGSMAVEPLLAIARPWLALREQWQAILDSAAPGSAMSRRAPEVLHYIDTQLGRLSGPAI